MSGKVDEQREAVHVRQRSTLLDLAPDVIERIAAGEVVERPASVVKELLENALDAGAREIRIDVRGGGLRLIRVSDDGLGILQDDLPRVCVRHTTSKLRDFEDLDRLHTLGFRGEALASIAAVAEIQVLSRAIETEHEEQPASWVTWRGGEILQRGQHARVRGTTISVSDLFYNVPARLSYTRATRTENGHIVQLVRRYALGYPSVRFVLALDEHIAVQTSGGGDLALTLAELYHLSLQEMIQEISATDGAHYTLHGYIGNRVLAQSSRQYITLFINGRWVHSHILLDALEQGYRGLLSKGKHPLLVLEIAVPTDEVDVNVHPAKTEVHLAQEKTIANALTETLKKALERSPALPESVTFPGPVLANQRRLPGPRRHGLHVAESMQAYQATVGPPETAEVIASLSPLAQLQQAVILAEAPDGSLYLVDQHRAHERVIYEHLRDTHISNRHAETANGHFLLEPVMVEMKRYQADLLEQRLPVLRDLGVECERFGGRSFLVRSVPVAEGYEQVAAHLQELAEIAAEDNTDWEDHLLIGLACRSAMRRGRVLSVGEQQALLRVLATTVAPAVCPHGSPILLHYSRAFLIEKFDW